MQQFTYTYTSAEKIMTDIRHIEQFSFWEWAILAGLVILMIAVVLFIIPQGYKVRDALIMSHEKRRKKQMLHQISLQREIENQIENEIKEEEQNRMGKK